MIYSTTNPTRTGRNRTRRLGAPLAVAALAVLLAAVAAGAAPLETDPLGRPLSAIVPTPAATAAPGAVAPAVPGAPGGVPVGGPRMAETGLVAPAGATPLPNISAPTWTVSDATTGQVLAAQNPHGKRRPASTLKALLGITMLPRLDANEYYTADFQDTAQEGTRVGMVKDQSYKVEDLWYALFLRSGNDAANGLAKAGADGDLARGVRMMQAEAQRLQAYDTTVVNASGLDEDGQFASAYDLALWGREGLARKDFRKYAGATRWTFPGNRTATATKDNSRDFAVQTENRLMGSYAGAIGIKPGYTTLAQNTLIAAAERDGRTVLVTLMGAPRGAVFPGAEALLDWGFANIGKVTPVGQLVDPVSVSVTSVEDLTPAIVPIDSKIYKEHKTSASSPLRKASPLGVADDFNWSIVAGSALVGILVCLAAARVVRTRRRYRRFGAVR
ncbi:MAG: D-alanyl-D-alanine carboxypeptidase family protein [Sporichthyaceae bacterium]